MRAMELEPTDAAGVSDTSAAPQGLVHRAREDADAFARLYRRHYDAVFRYCAHRLFDRAAAEDATSATFLKAVESLVGFSGDERAFRNWLYAIATNHINTQFRRARLWERFLKSRRPEPPAQRPAGERAPEADERTALLKQAIRGLKPRQQALITLRYFEDLDAGEIARVLGGSAATVRSQLSRALTRLRRRMHAAGIDGIGEV